MRHAAAVITGGVQPMPTDVAIVVGAVTGAFILFAVALAWAQFHTRASGKQPNK
jgi:hypothetical protein